MRVDITIVKPDLEEETLSFDSPAEVTLGRSANCVCCMDYDSMASRMHAVLLIEPPTVRIKDLNSTNGLVLNGEVFGGYGNEKLHVPQELRDGDELVIGRTVFRIHIDSGVEEDDNAASVVDTKETFHGGHPATESSGFSEETVSALSSLVPEIPGYKISNFLGSGRTGSVYKGFRIDSGDCVAIKVMFPDLSFSPKMLESYRREMEEIKELKHRNLVKYLSGGSLREKNVYMITEYVNGEDLSAYAYKFPGHIVPVPVAVKIFRQMCSGLAYAHQKGVMHRDLKPRKVLLGKEGDNLIVKVSDIGLYKIFEDSGLVLQGAIADAESRAYMSPEQMSDPHYAKASADVFSLGAIMYEMLAGVGPYNFPAGDETKTRPPIVPIDERCADLPESLVVIIDRCLLPDPEERYRNCGDLFDAAENVRI